LASLPKTDKGVVSSKHLRQFLKKKIQENGGDERDVMHMAGRLMRMAHNDTASMSNHTSFNYEEVSIDCDHSSARAFRHIIVPVCMECALHTVSHSSRSPSAAFVRLPSLGHYA
jgi:hypothetical protein